MGPLFFTLGDSIMSEKLISIIVPVYNTEKFLEECVNSVLSQVYNNIEVILVDDGSTDNSPELCDQLSNQDNRVKVIHKKNGGLSSARNAGMKEITGDYYLFLDSDDLWTYNDFLSDIVEIINNNFPDIVFFNYSNERDISNNYKRDRSLEHLISLTSKADTFKQLILNDKLQSSACNKVYKSALLNGEGFRFVERIYSEDIDWMARVMIAVKKISYLDRYAYYYRPNESSITHNIRYKNIVDLGNNIKKVVELSKAIEKEDYYEWYMNYCAYQFITFLNCAATYKEEESIKEKVDEMKKYSFLLNYHYNQKVKLCYLFNKIFGYKLTIKILKIFLRIRG